MGFPFSWPAKSEEIHARAGNLDTRRRKVIERSPHAGGFRLRVIHVVSASKAVRPLIRYFLTSEQRSSSDVKGHEPTSNQDPHKVC